MEDDEIEDVNKIEKKRSEATEYWKARFELGEVPTLDSAFTSEEHFQILYSRVQSLEKSVKTLDTAISCLVCVIIIIATITFILVF